MLQIGHLDLLKVESDSLEVQGCTLLMLMVWLHKYKVGHHDLIIIWHHIHLKTWIFLCVTHSPYRKACPHVFWSTISNTCTHTCILKQWSFPLQGVYQGKSILKHLYKRWDIQSYSGLFCISHIRGKQL